MAAAQDLHVLVQLEISEFCERCCVWKISDRHLRSPLNKSTGVPQRSRCMSPPTESGGVDQRTIGLRGVLSGSLNARLAVMCVYVCVCVRASRVAELYSEAGQRLVVK